MNVAITGPTPAAVLTRARQCACLLDVLRHDLNGAGITQREASLIELADDLASGLFRTFWELPIGTTVDWGNDHGN